MSASQAPGGGGKHWLSQLYWDKQNSKVALAACSVAVYLISFPNTIIESVFLSWEKGNSVWDSLPPVNWS